jgi:putative transposase
VPRYTDLDDQSIAMSARHGGACDSEPSRRHLRIGRLPEVIPQGHVPSDGGITAWQSGPLERTYPVIYLDVLGSKVDDETGVRDKAVYVAIAVLIRGQGESA